jgi:hypothetical protein
MFQLGQLGNALRVEHRHSDGSWSTMHADAGEHHDPAGHDPEREWAKGHVYVCRRCGEEVRISADEGQEEADRTDERATA